MALRHLVKVFLKREIQNDVGHCSAEDAVATMELVQVRTMFIKIVHVSVQ